MRINVGGLKVTGRKYEFVAENPLVRSSFECSFGGKDDSGIKCHEWLRPLTVTQSYSAI